VWPASSSRSPIRLSDVTWKLSFIKRNTFTGMSFPISQILSTLTHAVGPFFFSLRWSSSSPKANTRGSKVCIPVLSKLGQMYKVFLYRTDVQGLSLYWKVLLVSRPKEFEKFLIYARQASFSKTVVADQKGRVDWQVFQLVENPFKFILENWILFLIIGNFSSTFLAFF